MKKPLAQLKKGFTLVESMVAISVLSLAITGPMLIAQKGIGSAIYSKDQITAYYLAQEAVEFIRNVRDSNRITDTDWLQQFASCKQTPSDNKACRIDTRFAFSHPSAITVCPASGECGVISFDEATGLYGYDSGGSWRPSQFTRKVTINDLASPKEAAVTVTISWQTNLFSPIKSFTIKEYVFDF